MALWTKVLCFHWKSISSAKLPSMVAFFFTMTFDLLKILTIDKLVKRFEVLAISAVCMGIMERVNHPLVGTLSSCWRCVDHLPSLLGIH